MASPSLPYRKTSIAGDGIPHPAHLIVLLIVSLGALIWGSILITGRQETSLQVYLLLLGPFGATSAAFIFFRVHRNRVALFDVPVFITMLVFIRFGLIPLYSFANPEALNGVFLGQYNLLVRALLFVSLGMLAFWMGAVCFCLKKRGDLEFADSSAHDQTGRPHDSILPMAAGLYCAVFATKLYLLHAHLLNYAMSWKAYHSKLASLQVLGVIASLGSCALIVFAIERYSDPSDRKRKMLFILVFVSECTWGLIGGDKRYVLQNFLLVAIVCSIIQRKIHKGWLLVPFLGLVLFYPLSNTYRSLLRHNGGAASVTAATNLGYEAFSKAMKKQRGVNGWVHSGWRATMSRLDLLQSVGLVLSLGSRVKFLQGKERWWMIPYYQFIPRFIWSSKPILNKGARFSVALGYGDHTSTAITYPGDLYATYGLPGILAGMFLLGVVGQLLTNLIAGTTNKRRLFVYAAIFLIFTDMELDAFDFWSTFIKMCVIFSTVAFFVYRTRQPLRKAATGRNPA